MKGNYGTWGDNLEYSPTTFLRLKSLPSVGELPDWVWESCMKFVVLNGIDYCNFFSKLTSDGWIVLRDRVVNFFCADDVSTVVSYIVDLRRLIFKYLNGHISDHFFCRRYRCIKRSVFSLRKNKSLKKVRVYKEAVSCGDCAEEPFLKKNRNFKCRSLSFGVHEPISLKMRWVVDGEVDDSSSDGWILVGKGGRIGKRIGKRGNSKWGRKGGGKGEEVFNVSFKKTSFENLNFSNKSKSSFNFIPGKFESMTGGGFSGKRIQETASKIISKKAGTALETFAAIVSKHAVVPVREKFNIRERFPIIEHDEHIQIEEVAGDGDCQYHAVLKALTCENYPFDGDSKDLRKLVAIELEKKVRKNEPEYMRRGEFVGEIEIVPGLLRQNHFEKLDETGMLDKYNRLPPNRREELFQAFCRTYIDAVRVDQWGDRTTLSIMSEIFNLKITSFMGDDTRFCLSSPDVLESCVPQEGRREIFLLLDNKHYWKITPLPGFRHFESYERSWGRVNTVASESIFDADSCMKENESSIPIRNIDCNMSQFEKEKNDVKDTSKIGNLKKENGGEHVSAKVSPGLKKEFAIPKIEKHDFGGNDEFDSNSCKISSSKSTTESEDIPVVNLVYSDSSLEEPLDSNLLKSSHTSSSNSNVLKSKEKSISAENVLKRSCDLNSISKKRKISCETLNNLKLNDCFGNTIETEILEGFIVYPFKDLEQLGIPLDDKETFDILKFVPLTDVHDALEAEGKILCDVELIKEFMVANSLSHLVPEEYYVDVCSCFCQILLSLHYPIPFNSNQMRTCLMSLILHILCNTYEIRMCSSKELEILKEMLLESFKIDVSKYTFQKNGNQIMNSIWEKPFCRCLVFAFCFIFKIRLHVSEFCDMEDISYILFNKNESRAPLFHLICFGASIDPFFYVCCIERKEEFGKVDVVLKRKCSGNRNLDSEAKKKKTSDENNFPLSQTFGPLELQSVDLSQSSLVSQADEEIDLVNLVKQCFVFRNGFDVNSVMKRPVEGGFLVFPKSFFSYIPRISRLECNFIVNDCFIYQEDFQKLCSESSNVQSLISNYITKLNLKKLEETFENCNMIHVLLKIVEICDYGISFNYEQLKTCLVSFLAHIYFSPPDSLHPFGEMCNKLRKGFIPNRFYDSQSQIHFDGNVDGVNVIKSISRECHSSLFLKAFAQVFKIRFLYLAVYANSTSFSEDNVIHSGAFLDMSHRPFFVVISEIGNDGNVNYTLSVHNEEPKYKLDCIRQKNVPNSENDETRELVRKKKCLSFGLHSDDTYGSNGFESTFGRSNQNNVDTSGNIFVPKSFSFEKTDFYSKPKFRFSNILKGSFLEHKLPHFNSLLSEFVEEPLVDSVTMWSVSSECSVNDILKHVVEDNNLQYVSCGSALEYFNVFELLSAVFKILRISAFFDPHSLKTCVVSQLYMCFDYKENIRKEKDESEKLKLQNRYARIIRENYRSDFAYVKEWSQYVKNMLHESSSALLNCFVFSDLFHVRFKVALFDKSANGALEQRNFIINKEEKMWPTLTIVLIMSSCSVTGKGTYFILKNSESCFPLQCEEFNSGNSGLMNKMGRFMKKKVKKSGDRKPVMNKDKRYFTDDEYAALIAHANGTQEGEMENVGFKYFENVPSYKKHIQPSISEFFHHMGDSMLAFDICCVCSERIPKYLQDSNFCVEFLKFVGIAQILLRESFASADESPPSKPEDFIVGKYYLESSGISNIGKDGMKFNVCYRCGKCLFGKKCKLPPASLANGNELAEIPEIFRELNFAEQTFISPYRTVHRVIKLRDAGGVHGHRAFKGNCIAFPQDVQKVTKLIVPQRLDSIGEILQVIFVGKKLERANVEDCLRRVVRIRRDKVLAAIEEMRKYRPDLVVSQENLSALPEDDIPDEIWENVHFVEDDGALEDDIGYFKRGPEKPGDAPSDHGEMFGFGVVDVNSKSVPPEVAKMHAVKNFLNGVSEAKKNVCCENDGGEVDEENELSQPFNVDVDNRPILVFPRKGDPISEYNNPDLWSLGFPTLFTQGKGMPELYNKRKVYFSFKDWCSHALCIKDSRFRLHPTFLFYITNVNRRRDVALNSRLKILKKLTNEDVDAFNALKDMTTLEFEQAARAFQNTGKIENENLKKVTKILTVTGSQISSHVLSKLTMRQEIQSMFLMYGLPRLFLTINPNDFNSSIVCYYAGKVTKIECSPDELPNYWGQRLAASEDPVACAIFFNLMIEAILKHLFGCGDGGGKIGVLGKVKTYYGCVESQGRGTLHLHILVWLDGFPTPSELNVALESPEFRQCMINWINTIMSASIGQCNDESLLKRAQIRPTLPLPENFHEEFQLGLIKTARRFQVHKCTFTCHKFNAGKGKCRFGFSGDGQPLRPETSISDNGKVEIERNNPFVNQYNPAMLYCLQSNMDIKFLSTAEDSRAIAFYVSFYVTKDALTCNNILSMLGVVFEKMRRYPVESKEYETRIKKCCREVERCFNQLNSMGQVCGPEAASYLLGDRPFRQGKYGEAKHSWDHYTSCYFEPLFTGEFLKDMVLDESVVLAVNENNVNEDNVGEDEIDQDAQRHFNEEKEMEMLEENERNEDAAGYMDINIDPNGNFSFSSLREDYLYRSEKLENVCLYEFVSQYKKIRCKLETVHVDGKSYRVAKFPTGCLKFENGHPLANFYYISKRNKFVCPRIAKLPPNRNVQPETYAKMTLLLFVPFRVSNSLNQTWVQQLHKFQPSWELAVDVHKTILSFKHVNSIFLRNLEEIQGAMQQMLINAEMKEANGIVEDDTKDTNKKKVSDDDVFFDLGEDADLLDFSQGDKYEECIPVDETSAAMVADLDNIMGPEADFGNVFVDIAPVNDEFFDISGYKDNFKSWKSELKRQNLVAYDKLMGLESEIEVPAAGNINVNSQAENVSNQEPHVLFLATSELNRIQKDLIAKFTLNEEQSFAFRIVAEHVSKTLMSLHDEKVDKPEPLFLLVLGEGGTGKSRIIACIREFFKEIDKNRWLKICAPTGKAASLIKGTTIHSLFGLAVKKKYEKKIDKVTSKKTASTWSETRYCVIDEVSMVGARLLQQCSESVVGAKGEAGSGDFFSGVNVIMFGDFHQFRPVSDVALFSNSAKLLEKSVPKDIRNNNKPVPIINASNIAPYTGLRNFLSNFTNIVILKKQVRAAGDTNYLEFLQRSRQGKYNEKDIEFLQLKIRQRIPEEKFFTTRFIVGMNNTAEIINVQMIRRFSKYYNRTIFFFENPGKFETVEGRVSSSVRRDVLKLTNNESLGIDGRVFLCIGCPVTVTTNLQKSLGITNGATGSLHAIIFDSEDEQRIQKHPGGGVFRLKHLPLCVIVKFHNKIEFQGTNLPENCAPIFPLSVVFDFNYSAEEKIPNTALIERVPRKLKIHRKGFPITLNFASTAHKCQGETLDSAVIDLVASHRLLKNVTASYVPLSRLRTGDNLSILREFEPNDLLMELDSDLIEFMEKAEELAEKTKEKFNFKKYFPMFMSKS